jgi:hypothetical protein
MREHNQHEEELKLDRRYDKEIDRHQVIGSLT